MRKVFSRNYIRVGVIILAALFAQGLLYTRLHFIVGDLERLDLAQFISIYLGGPTLEESVYPANIVMYFLPLYMICTVLADVLITEFKDNFIYIFTRTKRRQVFYNRIVGKVIQYLILYHAALLIIGLLIEQPSLVITLEVVKQGLITIGMSFLQCLALVLFNQMIRLSTEEQFSSFIGYLLLVFPIMLAGYFRQRNPGILKLVLLFPFNQGIYNYYEGGHWICVMYLMIFIGVVYTIARKQVITYEVL